MNILLGMKILWIIFRGHPKIGLVLGFFLCILGSFLKVNIQKRDILGVAKNQLFYGVLGIPDIFFFFFFLGGGGGGKQ